MSHSDTEDVTLSKRQQTVFNWLNDELNLPVYADAYKGAIDCLNRKPAGYITSVSHVGRDLMNELAATVQEMQSAPTDGDLNASEKRSEGAHVDYPELVDELLHDWKDEWGREKIAHAEFQPNHDVMPDESASIQNGYVIPRETCKKIQKLIDAHRAGHQRDLDKGVLFFTSFWGYVHEEEIPADLFKDWKDAKRWFGAHNHLRKGNFSKKKSCDVQRHFRMLDELLYIAATSTYERIKEIYEILEETNQ